MKVTILEFPDDKAWLGVKQRALVTVGLNAVNPPDEEWKRKMLTCRHSPIRYLRFSFYLEDVPSYVSVHLTRHKHAEPYVKSQRNDRQQDYDRTKAPQDAPVNMIWDLTGEELLIVMNKRLCGQADIKTQELMHMIRDAIIERDPMYRAFLVPMCIYMGKCPEVFKKECSSVYFKKYVPQMRKIELTEE